jgi:putative ABC transport system permease protein
MSAFLTLHEPTLGLAAFAGVLALMALLLALSANIGVGTMVMSFRDTFTGWLDQRLVAEVYVTASDAEQGRAIHAWATDRVDAVLPIWSAEARLGAVPISIYGVAQHPTYSEHWPLIEALPGAWQSVARGDGALINEQMAARGDLSPGDTLILPTPDGTDWPLTITAIYSDYGNPVDQVMVDVGLLATRYPDIERLRFALRTADAPQVIEEARARFGLSSEQVVDQAAIKALSLAIFERTFTVTGALNILTLAVAALALLTAMLTLQLMRLPSLAPLWAMGLTRAALARAELVKVLALALLTAILSIPIGLGVAWVLTNVINVMAFGWRLPMNLYPMDWLRLIGLALLTATVAAGLPVLRLARTAPRTLLGVFASER